MNIWFFYMGSNQAWVVRMQGSLLHLSMKVKSILVTLINLSFDIYG